MTTDQRINVFYLMDNLTVGGAEKSLLQILKHFRQTQPVMCHISPASPLRPAFEQAGIRVVSLNVPGKYPFVLAWLRLVRALHQERPDLIHLVGFHSGLIGRAAGKWVDIPVIDSFANETYTAEHYASLPPRSRRKLRIAQLLERFTFRWVCHVIAVSETVRSRNSHMLGISPKKVSVIYRGRDPQPFLKIDTDVLERLRGTLSISPGTAVLLNVSRLIPRKGQAELIKAMPLVQQSFPKTRLFIAGKGHHRPELETLIRKLGLSETVDLLGVRDDIPTLLHLADMFVFPSHYEGHPGSLIEAMLAARPIVAADTPVHQETIIDGETGLLFPVGNPEALARGIIWMLQHPTEAKQMGERARQVALDRFDIEQIAAQHEEIYRLVLQNSDVSDAV
jgi:glycosyltransferase involved in cell wall biosynthesis